MPKITFNTIAAFILAAAATFAMAPAPANAMAVSCSSRIDVYQNQYEVTFTHAVDCDGPVEAVWARIQSYKPSTKTGDKWCQPARWCRGTVGFVNTPGTQEYCVKRYGEWYPTYSDYRNSNPRTFPTIYTCTTA